MLQHCRHNATVHSSGSRYKRLFYHLLSESLLIFCPGEMAVLFPVNGAFYKYTVRFIDPAW